MLFKTPFKLDQGQREIFPVQDESFPVICRWSDLNWYDDKTIPWHWHTELEINCIDNGTMECQTLEQTVTVEKGEILFINSGVLHTCRTVIDEPCQYYTYSFDMHFLSGMYNSLFEKKYFLPVVRNSALSVWKVKADSLEHLEMISAVMKSIELCRNEPKGYEFDLRAKLCDFWKLLLDDTADVRATARPHSIADTERIKVMIRFIHDNYGEKITLEDIAASACISTRECTRCFRRCINTTPNNFLTGYRLRMAIRLLVESSKTILEISEECGFSSASYFTKVFRETRNCTPKEYRESNQQCLKYGVL